MTTDPLIAGGPFRVPPELDAHRLDIALCHLLPDLSRSRLQELIHDGGVSVEGEPVMRPSLLVQDGQTVTIADVRRSRIRSGDRSGKGITVLFEDADLAVIDKPAGMVTHPSNVVQGGTVSELAVERWGPLPSPQGEDRPGIVHRLDGDTSGLLVIAKTEAAAVQLMESFRERQVEKTYLAIVYGEPRFDSDWIELPIGRSPKRPDRMAVLGEGEGRTAETFYETRERFGDFSLVACFPRTGRTHQIRLHLAAIEHPVVGDKLYRGRRGLTLRVPKGAPLPARHALHAAGLALQHPVSGEKLAFEAPLPEDMGRLLAWLRER